MLAPYPNPARGGNATLRFRLDRTRHIRLRIHDGSGRLVRELLDEDRAAGLNEVRWNGRTTFGQPAASGAYFATIESGVERASTRFLLLR
jgi:flagellar hook assembly protein FlgD